MTHSAQFLRSTLLPVFLGLAFSAIAAPGQAPMVHPRAHSHNDYEHGRPLVDALDQGFCSVEADVHLVGGELLVAHDRSDAKPGRTLQALYLDPLRARVRSGDGHVQPTAAPFFLLIDIKSDAEAVYARLRDILSNYRDILTVFRSDGIETRAVTVILSGDRPWKTMASEKERWAGLDGRLPDLETDVPGALVPLVSDNWRTHFTWNGEGEFPRSERDRLKTLVSKAHAQGRRLRFWGAADVPAMWAVQWEAGVDFINTDHLAELATFLSKREGVEKRRGGE